MAVKFPVGTAVQQIVPAPVQGVIDRFVFDPTSGDIHCIIKDITGHEWSFREDQVEAVVTA